MPLVFGDAFNRQSHLFSLLEREVFVNGGLLVRLVQSLVDAVGFPIFFNCLQEVEAVVTLREDHANERLLALVGNQLESERSCRVVGALNEGFPVLTIRKD